MKNKKNAPATTQKVVTGKKPYNKGKPGKKK
jgi:hypothetical protein